MICPALLITNPEPETTSVFLKQFVAARRGATSEVSAFFDLAVVPLLTLTRLVGLVDSQNCSSVREVAMEAKEEAQIRSLLDADPELRRYYDEHVELKQRLEVLRQKAFLTEEEEIEQKQIQKQKLAGKDRMMEILARHRQAAA